MLATVRTLTGAAAGLCRCGRPPARRLQNSCSTSGFPGPAGLVGVRWNSEAAPAPARAPATKKQYTFQSEETRESRRRHGSRMGPINSLKGNTKRARARFAAMLEGSWQPFIYYHTTHRYISVTLSGEVIERMRQLVDSERSKLPGHVQLRLPAACEYLLEGGDTKDIRLKAVPDKDDGSWSDNGTTIEVWRGGVHTGSIGLSDYNNVELRVRGKSGAVADSFKLFVVYCKVLQEMSK